VTEVPPDSPSLPLKTVEELGILESFLNLDGNFKSLVAYLSKTGGSGDKDATERVMKEVLTNLLASKLNWKGVVRKKMAPKVGIQVYPRVIKLIKASVRAIEPKASEKSIEECIKYWLKHSKRRVSLNAIGDAEDNSDTEN
jgi:hypothetical protein